MTEQRFSDELATRVTTAIEEILAESGGGMLNGFAIAVTYYDSEGEACWAHAYPDRQLPMTTLGILRWHTLSAEGDVARYLGTVSGDEEP